MKELDMIELKRIHKAHHIPAGGYVCRIEEVEYDTELEELFFTFDICEGEYRGFFIDTVYSFDYYDSVRLRNYFTVSCNENDLLNFIDFVIAVEQSNPGFTFDGVHETNFQYKEIGLILREEEYIENDKIRTTLNVVDFTNVENIHSGNYHTYGIKCLNECTGICQKSN